MIFYPAIITNTTIAPTLTTCTVSTLFLYFTMFWTRPSQFVHTVLTVHMCYKYTWAVVDQPLKPATVGEDTNPITTRYVRQ